MPRIEFNELPASARVWIFASDRPLRGPESARLLTEVDEFLARWQAHGAPLRSARDWRDDHFLVIGVDPSVEQASGCSIDGLFRGLQALERALDTRLVAGGRVFYRDETGSPRVVARPEANRYIDAETPVFDIAITDAGSYRDRFERPAAATWVAALLGRQDSQAARPAATNSSSARNA